MPHLLTPQDEQAIREREKLHVPTLDLLHTLAFHRALVARMAEVIRQLDGGNMRFEAAIAHKLATGAYLTEHEVAAVMGNSQESK